jgi:hypothetical protein
MNGIHKGNNRLLAEYVQTGKGAIDDELHFEDVTLFFFFFFLSSLLSFMCAYAISFHFLFGGAIYTHLCIFLCVCVSSRGL